MHIVSNNVFSLNELAFKFWQLNLKFETKKFTLRFATFYFYDSTIINNQVNCSRAEKSVNSIFKLVHLRNPRTSIWLFELVVTVHRCDLLGLERVEPLVRLPLKRLKVTVFINVSVSVALSRG